MPFDTPGATAPKPFADPPASRHYRATDGSFVPSVTTILDVINKPAIAEWANRLGLFKHVQYKEHLNSLARAGTLLHAKIEAELRGKAAPDESQYSSEEVNWAFQSWFHWSSWRRQHQIRPLALELPLVSAVHGYGGTIDCIAELDGEPCVIDWKSSIKPYESHFLQVAAYQALVREVKGVNLSAIVVCCQRGGTKFNEARVEPDERMEALFDTFLRAKGLYEGLNRIGKTALDLT